MNISHQILTNYNIKISVTIVFTALVKKNSQVGLLNKTDILNIS